MKKKYDKKKLFQYSFFENKKILEIIEFFKLYYLYLEYFKKKIFKSRSISNFIV